MIDNNQKYLNGNTNLNPLTWQTANPAQPQTLEESDVHVWLVDNSCVEIAATEHSVLDQDELTRAARFKFDIHRQRFIASHTALRHILSAYLDVPPQTIQYAINKQGKPFLTHDSQWHFNLSHSENFALVAVSKHEVGVDIEIIADRDEMQLAKRFFATAEYQWLTSLPQDQMQNAFFQIWSRKEAIIKATGLGLVQLGLETFVTTPIDDTLCQLPELHMASIPKSYYLYNIPVEHGFKAALATHKQPECITCYRYAIK